MGKRRKSSSAARKLFDYAVVLDICRVITKCAHPDEDFVQDVCLRLIEKAGQYRGESNWKTWASAVARNLFVGQKRHADVENKYMVPFDESEGEL